MRKLLGTIVLVVAIASVAAACRPPTLPPAPLPAPPLRNVTITPGDRSITATFDRDLQPGPHRYVNGYRLTCGGPRQQMMPPNGPGWVNHAYVWMGGSVSVDGDRSPLVISLDDQLVNGVTLSCTVQAITRDGVGEPGAAQQVTPIGPPRVAYEVPYFPGPGMASFFVNVYLESDERASFACDVDAPGVEIRGASTCSFGTTGLTPGVEYSATVTPRNALGVGPPYTFTFSVRT